MILSRYALVCPHARKASSSARLCLLGRWHLGLWPARPPRVARGEQRRRRWGGGPQRVLQAAARASAAQLEPRAKVGDRERSRELAREAERGERVDKRAGEQLERVRGAPRRRAVVGNCAARKLAA